MMKRPEGLTGVIALVLTWGLVWAMPGAAIEAMANVGAPVPGTDHVDMWPQTLAIPGLVGGMIFSALVAATGRWHTFETSSLAVVVGLGVIAGLVVGGVFMAAGWVGGESTPWEFAFATVMSVISAIASALLFRFLARKQVSPRASA